MPFESSIKGCFFETRFLSGSSRKIRIRGTPNIITAKIVPGSGLPVIYKIITAIILA